MIVIMKPRYETDMNVKMSNNTDIASPVSGRARITLFVNKYSNAVHTHTHTHARFPVFCDHPRFFSESTARSTVPLIIHIGGTRRLL
jgi:hypothetical protein